MTVTSRLGFDSIPPPRTFPARPLRVALAWTAAAWLSASALADAAGAATFRPAGNQAESFSFELPPAEMVVDEEGEINVSIQSDQGYVFGLVGEPGKVALETADFIHNAEAIVVGENRVWSNKVGFQIISVGGLPAYDGTYEGLETRGRLVLARGAEIDLVFFFRAWTDQYERVAPVFESILASFQWHGSGTPATARPQAPSPTIADEPKPATPTAETSPPALAALPPDRRASAADPKEIADVDALAAYFETIVFGAEFEQSQAASVIAKWEGPVRISVQGRATDKHREFILRHTAEISRLTGLAFEWVNGKDQPANLTVAFVPRLQMGQVKIPKVDAALQARLAGQGGCYFVSFREPESRIVASVVVVNSERQEDGINHCLLEEITQSLGLPNDSDVMRPSLFSDRDQLLAFSRHDEILVRTLYDPRLRTGLPKREALAVARDIIAELNRALPKP